MEINARLGQRVLFKDRGQWTVGTLEAPTELTNDGLYLTVNSHLININDIFLEAVPVEDWMRQYGNLLTKEEYIEFINSEDFEKNLENAYVSDGEYYYYSVNKYTANWLNKQPFDYIVRG